MDPSVFFDNKIHLFLTARKKRIFISIRSNSPNKQPNKHAYDVVCAFILKTGVKPKDANMFFLLKLHLKIQNINKCKYH